MTEFLGTVLFTVTAGDVLLLPLEFAACVGAAYLCILGINWCLRERSKLRCCLCGADALNIPRKDGKFYCLDCHLRIVQRKKEMGGEEQ